MLFYATICVHFASVFLFSIFMIKPVEWCPIFGSIESGALFLGCCCRSSEKFQLFHSFTELNSRISVSYTCTHIRALTRRVMCVCDKFLPPVTIIIIISCFSCLVLNHLGHSFSFSSAPFALSFAMSRALFYLCHTIKYFASSLFV